MPATAGASPVATIQIGGGLDMATGDRVAAGRGGIAPLVPAALAVASGVMVDRLADPWGTLTWASLAAGLAAISAWAGGRSAVGAWLLVMSLAALGGGWHHYRWSDLAPDDPARGDHHFGAPAWVRGEVEDVPAFRPGRGRDDLGSTRTTLGLSAFSDGRDWHPASGHLLLRVRGDRVDLEPGTLVETAGTLEAIPSPLNPGEFDSRDLLRARGLRLSLDVDDPEGIESLPRGPSDPSGWWSWNRLLGQARSWSYRTLVARLDPSVAPLAAALLLGRREAVDPEVNDAFARTGTTHLLAISGLHLQALAWALFGVARVAGMRRPLAFAWVIGATLTYALLVGLAPSVARSAAMTVAACLAGLRDRPVRPANVLSLAALATLALNPSYLFDVGCQLSFLAVGAIVWGVQPANDWVGFLYARLTFRIRGPESPLDALERAARPWWRALPGRLGGGVAEGLMLSLVVWLAALPLVWLRFHLVSPIGVLLNVPLIPITSLALLAAGLTLALGAIWPPLAAAPAWACHQLLALTEFLVRWGASQRWAFTYDAAPPLWWVVGFYGILGALLLVGPGRRRVPRWSLVGWTLLGVVVLWPGRPGEAEAEAEVLAVGHGLATLLRADDGSAVLYDCGRLADPGIGRKVIAPALWARGVRRLDAVFLSHADADHYDGLPDLLDRIPIGEVRVPPSFPRSRDPGVASLLAAVRARGVPVVEVAQGGQWPFGRTGRLTVLHPPKGWRPTASDNARSLVIDVQARGWHFLLTGDLEGPGLTELLDRRGRPPEVLLSPHHGGRTANPPALFSWADDATVVVSQRRGSAGARDPLQPIEARGVPILRTWQRGAIRLRWSAEGIAATGFLDRPPPMASLGPLPLPGRLALGLLGFALGAALCLALAVVEWGAWSLVVPGRKAPGPVDLIEPPWEPMTLDAPDGATLRGLWLTATGQPRGLALLLHGFGETGDALKSRAETLAVQGWCVAVPDGRGQGSSGGVFVSFGGREASDAVAWLDLLADRLPPGLPSVIWGRSMGAAVALRAAAIDARIAALVLEAPYPDLAKVVASVLSRQRIPAARFWAGPLLRRAGILAGAPLSSPRPIDLAPAMIRPVLIVHGNADRLVPIAEARRLFAAFPTMAEFLEVPKARHHDVFEVGGPSMAAVIAEFLDRSTPRPG